MRIFSSVVTALLIVSAASGVTGCSKLGLGDAESPTGPSAPPPAGSTIRYTAIGASDAIGWGSTQFCIPFATSCPNGQGYVPVAERQLEGLGYTVSLLNLGIPSAVISRRVQTLGGQYGGPIVGNFIDSEMPFVQTDATLVTIFAGGNDANWIRAAANGGAGGTDVNGFIDQQIRSFGEDYSTLIDGIRNQSKSARIVVLNLPNLGGLPYLAGASLNDRRMAQRISVGMTTTVINPFRTSKGVVVVDLMCEARLYQASSISSDGFHPNDTGYSIIAAAVVSATTSNSYPAPSSSCGEMTRVP